MIFDFAEHLRAHPDCPGIFDFDAHHGAAWCSSGCGGQGASSFDAARPDSGAMEAIRAYLQIEGNGAGGSLHIVLDDFNFEDGHVDYCIEYAEERGDEEGARLGRMLRALPAAVRLATIHEAPRD